MPRLAPEGAVHQNSRNRPQTGWGEKERYRSESAQLKHPIPSHLHVYAKDNDITKCSEFVKKTIYFYLSLATQKLILEAEGSLSQQCLHCSVVPVGHG